MRELYIEEGGAEATNTNSNTYFNHCQFENIIIRLHTHTRLHVNSANLTMQQNVTFTKL